MRFFRLFIEFPALNRLMDYLEAAQQQEIDDAARRIRKVSAGLKAALQTEEE